MQNFIQFSLSCIDCKQLISEEKRRYYQPHQTKWFFKKNETYERNEGVLKKKVVLVSVHYLKAKYCTIFSNREHLSKRVTFLTNTNTKVLQIFQTKTNTLFI